MYVEQKKKEKGKSVVVGYRKEDIWQQNGMEIERQWKRARKKFRGLFHCIDSIFQI